MLRRIEAALDGVLHEVRIAAAARLDQFAHLCASTRQQQRLRGSSARPHYPPLTIVVSVTTPRLRRSS